ncbi:hypothetical protein CRUP_037472 [Coryphaenoides rupestris]|nr:hypothetical protein CRUP_037472 [Coryphaenoides rupestris]
MSSRISPICRSYSLAAIWPLAFFRDSSIWFSLLRSTLSMLPAGTYHGGHHQIPVRSAFLRPKLVLSAALSWSLVSWKAFSRLHLGLAETLRKNPEHQRPVRMPLRSSRLPRPVALACPGVGGGVASARPRPARRLLVGGEDEGQPFQVLAGVGEENARNRPPETPSASKYSERLTEQTAGTLIYVGSPGSSPHAPPPPLIGCITTVSSSTANHNAEPNKEANRREGWVYKKGGAWSWEGPND